jgi:hypothetical protein
MGGGGIAPASSTFAPAPAAPAPTYGQAPAGGVKTASQCNAEYAANKAAIRASGQTKRDFVASCRAGTVGAPYSRGRNQQTQRQRPPLRRPTMPRLRQRPARASSRQNSKRAIAALRTRSFGSTRSPESTTSQGPRITAIRSEALACVRPTPRRPATAPP